MSNLNLKPYELSLWKDEKVIINPNSEEQDIFYNIYKGLDTNEEDLSFWYLPRNWNDGSFIPNEKETGKVKVKIKPRSQRKEGLVHLDFSTSSLMFKPNSYYTFLLELDFQDGDKKPNWKPYQAVNPTVNRHYFLSLVRQDVPNSRWHMPKPIFDSSLNIMYGKDGFGMDGTYLKNEKEYCALFVDKSGVNAEKDIPNASCLRFIGCLKTNDFLKEQSTLGMWSFIESWIDDYWEADMRISVFEETFSEEVPMIYSKLYKLYSDINFEDISSEKSAKELLIDNLKKVLNEEVIAEYSTGYIVKTTINNYIQNYYKNLQQYVQYIYDTKGSVKSLKNDDDFKNNYLGDTSIKPKVLTDISKDVSKIFYNYFPCLTFPYLDNSGNVQYYLDETHFSNVKSCKDDGLNRKQATLNFLKEAGEKIMNGIYNDFSLLNDDILIKPTVTDSDVYIKFNNIDDNFSLIIKDNTKNKEYEEYIDKKINDYWNKFLDKSGNIINNKLYNYFDKTYLDDLQEPSFEDFYMKDTEDLPETYSEDYKPKLARQMNQTIELSYRCGMTLLLSPANYQVFEDLMIKTKSIIGTSKVRSSSYCGAIISTIASYLFEIQENYMEYAFPTIFHNEPGAYEVTIYPTFSKQRETDEVKTNYSKIYITSGSEYGKIFKDTLGRLSILGEDFISAQITFFSQLLPIIKDNLSDKIITIMPKEYSIEYLKEKKYCVFGSLDGPKSYAQDVVFKSNTTGDIHTITFSLYDNYYLPFSEEKEKNPFISLLKNEDKIKLKYNNEWYDFIITDVELDSSEHKTNYTAKDKFVIELSKEGFNKTFNTELDNNVGNIDELSKKILENTDWIVGNNDKFYQSMKKAIFGGQLKENIIIKIVDFYYDRNLEKQNNNEIFTINANSYIYMFYDESTSGVEKPKIICLDWNDNSNINLSEYEKIDDVLINVNICPNYEIYKDGVKIETLPFKEYDVAFPDINTNFLKIKTLDIFKDGENDKLDFNYGLRAKDIIIKPKMHYSIPLKRYVTEFKKDNNILYGYVDNKYTTKALVQNLLPNGQDFTSLNGWVNGAVNNIHNIKMGLDAATVGNDMNTITPYLNFSTSVESNNNRVPHGFVCNTELGYNFAGIDHLTPGDEFVLRIQLERGKNLKNITSKNYTNFDDQLTLMESMHPHLYMYDGSHSLQSKNNLSVLPKAKQQVMFFNQNKRIIDEAKYKSKMIQEETWGTNGSFGSYYINDLSDIIDNYSLVPIYWARFSKDYKTLTVAQNNKENPSEIGKFPCAYITQSLARTWAYQGYIVAYNNVANSNYKNPGHNKDYYFTASGWTQFCLLFRNTDKNSQFNLRDFYIIVDTHTGDTVEIDYNNYGSGAQYSNLFADLENGDILSMNYYLPMLFSDNDLIDEIKKINNNNLPDDLTKINLCKKFFQYENWAEVLKTKEYYEINSIGRKNGELRAYPHFPEDSEYQIEFDSSNRIGDCIAYFGDGDYRDFDLLMRMRAFWRIKRYSEEGTCIFETDGIFFGKPLKDGTSYSFTTDTQNEPIGYSYQDLLSQHLGLFFTFDQTVYDDGARGNTSMALSKIELFRKYKDENGEIVSPNNIIEANTTPIYHFYNPVINKDVKKEEDMQYEYVGVTIPEGYNINIDETGERRNSITITESNCYNMLQKLAEIFDGWLILDVEHNSDGSLKLDENTFKPIKKAYFINTKYNDNYSGIKYGINLKKIGRKIDSNDIITKMIVKNNNNEYGTDGFCSIARSPLNLNGTNSILKLNYYIQMGILPQEIIEKLYNEIYPRTYVYGQFLSKTITERAEELIIQSQKQAYKEYYQLVLDNAKAKLSEQLDQYSSFENIGASLPIGFYMSNPVELNKLSSTLLKNIINSVIFYTGLINGFTQKLVNAINEYEDSVRKYDVLTDLIDGVTQQRDYLLNQFYSLCREYIKEGSWSSEDYIDDDLYYLDAERQADEHSVPKVSYTIDITDISSLSGFENYTYRLRDKTTMEDPEIFGYDVFGTPIKEEIIITEKTEYLQSPDKNIITVQNYKTQFADLFQRILSTIQAVEFGTLNYSNKKTSNNYDIKINNNTASLQALKQYNGI